MKARLILYAEDGYVLTDGTNYGRVIHLASEAVSDNYYEITSEEYEVILAEQETASNADFSM